MAFSVLLLMCHSCLASATLCQRRHIPLPHSLHPCNTLTKLMRFPKALFIHLSIGAPNNIYFPPTELYSLLSSPSPYPPPMQVGAFEHFIGVGPPTVLTLDGRNKRPTVKLNFLIAREERYKVHP